MNRRIVVTGGAGFIGSHLCEFLLNKGDKVICIDNLATGNMENIKDFFYEKNFSFINYDITNYVYISGEVDWVLNLASLASPIFYQKYPIKTLKVGAIGTYRTLDLAKKKGAKYLFTSTSEVYGDPLVNPQPESYWGNVNSIGIRSCYDESKRYAEALIMAYHRKYNLDIRIARIFNTYGPKMRKDDGRVVPTFIEQALNNKDLTVFGDGTQTRSFCYISDMINGLDALMAHSVKEPVNLGNQNEITILELAKKIIDMINCKSDIVFKPLPKDDPKVRRPDITKAKELLDWSPKISLEEGLEKTIKLMKR